MRCGLLGRKLGHSFSPRLHGLLADYAYELFEVEPEALERFLRDGSFDGLNVTIPYKMAVMPFCELTDRAKKIGAVNTITRRDGRLIGDNTDYDGFSWLLDRNGGIRAGEKALVLGSGGASKTAQTVLHERGAEVVVISRSGADNYENLGRHADAALLVNTTPVGMFPNNGASPVDLRRLPGLRTVLDVVYNPLETALLLQARALGLRAENGLSMLVGQGCAAAERFTGRPVDEQTRDRALQALRRDSTDLILIGMPGSGKTTLGRALAARLGRPFLDCDEEFSRRFGRTPAEALRADGEDAFREQETSVLAELGKRSGVVLATGGGCVTRPENAPLLLQNGFVVWVQRPLDALALEDRPLSAQGTDKLYARREPLYRALAQTTIVNDSAPETAVKRTEEAFYEHFNS